MNAHFKDVTLKATQASQLVEIEVIQNLWSGYGKIVRYKLIDSPYKSVVIKHVRLPKGGNHPRGWNTNLSHERKVKSYQVEMAWYQQYSNQCDDNCRIPKCLAEATFEDEVLMVLEDLDASGFPYRHSEISWPQINSCLSWLANFHATFLHIEPENLWITGTYWHLATRPDELEALNDKNLKNAAPIIDNMLNQAKYKTFVHGDAKLANFCFGENNKVAAVDFQYVGGGCGMKDVAYFIGSCLYEDDCEKYEDRILDFYFSALRSAIEHKHNNISINELEQEWRKLYTYAWTDFHRFLKGWSPGHWKINSYSERMASQVIQNL